VGKWKGYNFCMGRILAGLLLISVLTACANTTPTVTADVPAVPYQTTTPSATPGVLPLQTEIVPPTPTTFIYKVVQGDTLVGIAKRFNVTLEALLAANPSAKQGVLQVGATLTIPTGNQPSTQPTPTPASVEILQARCLPETGGGLWCFALLQNQYPETLENLSVLFTLLDTSGQVAASQAGYGLLDILPPGQAMPLALHFPAPVGADATLRVQVLTAIRLLPGDTRYIPVMVEDTLINAAASGLTVQVSGGVVLTGTKPASSLWILATAYDSAGNVAGVRRWESSSPLTTETPVLFDFQVSSLGPKIDKVEFLTEARP
jgi:LysM repeat protein